MTPRLRIRTEQLSDSRWKASAVDMSLVVYANTKRKAIKILKMVVGNRDQDRTKDLGDLHQDE